MAEKLTGKALEDFMAKARKQFENDAADEKELREFSTLNQLMVAGDQWDEGIKAARIKAGRPALTFNRSHTFVQKVANESRENKTEIKFSPFEEDDKETAEILEGIARQIQYSSDAEIAYETAADNVAGGTFAYIRFLPEYCDDDTDNQELKAIPVYDPLSVYGVLIPACYGQDAKHAFVIEEIPKDEYIDAYGESYVAKNWDECSTKYSGWVSTETVKVAEYWYVEEERVAGKTGRMVTKRKVCFCKMNGVEVLPGSETEWVGKTIPIIAVLGKLQFVKGKPRLFGVISHQMDSQRLVNIYKTRIAETLGTSPIQQYMVPRGSITPELRSQWEQMNTSLRPYLEYNAIVDGQVVPAPQRQVFEAPIQALSEAAAQEIDGQKAGTGIYDASLGNKSNESSGIALTKRQQESDDVNMHIIGNLDRAKKKAGKEIIAPAIFRLYDGERVQQILGKDLTPRTVMLNKPYDVGGKKKHYAISPEHTVKYDAVVSVGKSFSSKKMESFDMYVQLGQYNPEMAMVTSDLMLRNSDMAGSDEAADRMKKVVYAKYPFLQDENDEQPIPPQVQAQLQQMQQQLQVTQQVGQQMHQEIEQYKAGAQVKQMEIEHKENLERMKLDFEKWKHETSLGLQDKKLNTDATLKSAQIESNEATAIFNAEVDMAKTGMQMDAQAVAAEAGQAAEQI